jgi:hypothetical protein
VNQPLIAADSAAWMLLIVGTSVFACFIWAMVQRIRGQG